MKEKLVSFCACGDTGLATSTFHFPHGVPEVSVLLFALYFLPCFYSERQNRTGRGSISKTLVKFHYSTWVGHGRKFIDKNNQSIMLSVDS